MKGISGHMAIDELWVLLPAFNEAAVIREVIRNVRTCGYHHIIVVDDGSSDDTARIALEEKTVLLSHPVNRGAGAVIQTGILYARLKGINTMVQMDSDGQHHPEDIDHLFKTMQSEDCDIVVGSRFMGGNYNIPKIRVFYNSISNIITNWFCKRWYSDTQSGFRMFNRRAIEKLDLQIDGFGYCSEMIIQAERKSLRISEVPISVSYTKYSMSKGQDFFMGVVTATNLFWKLLFNPRH